MKVLLSTYSCFPCKTSEPGNAWRAINEALREHEVWAVISDAHQYRELTEQYADLVIQETRQDLAGSKKKQSRPKSSWPRTRKSRN